jgi:hypothetical protein
VRVATATFCESGASLSTIETVETENPQALAMSSSVTWPDFRWAISFSRISFSCLKSCLGRSALIRHSRHFCVTGGETFEIMQMKLQILHLL